MEEKRRYCTLISFLLSVVGLVLFIASSSVVSISLIIFTIYLIGAVLCSTLIPLSFIEWKDTRINYKRWLGLFIAIEFFYIGMISLCFFQWLAVFLVPETYFSGEIILLLTAIIYLIVFVLLLIDLVQSLKYKSSEKDKEILEEDKKMSQIRPFTLSSGIISVLCMGLFFVSLFSFICEEYESSSGLGSEIPFLVWINLLVSACSVMFGIISICLSNLRVEVYRKYRSLMLTSFVFNCIIFIISFAFIIQRGANTFSGLSAVAALAGSVVAAIFTMLDIARKGRPPKQVQFAQRQTILQQTEAPKPATEKPLAQSLQEIKEMKDAGLINEDDYEKLKANILSNYKF